MKSESKIQAESVKWFNNNYCLKHHNPRMCIFSVPNEAIQKMNWKQISTFKATGLKSGVSDTIVIMPEKVLFIEFKTSTGRMSEKQKNFKYQVENLRHKYYIARSLEDFKQIIFVEMK